ncbi:GNAT family N-acetyltransferase [Empedobacter brevis]|uniref:GNAT family N-acetyltransferase n=1 Tax=Empedobacter brevis TaxID=247 RepID=UPI00123CB734|nr:GNAT family N-acetyltransferase [Empedobacter brevis]QES94098.1 GNAT family N-acetyltransferase [Empedobacter brevis]
MEDDQLYFRELLDTDVERLFEIYSNADAMKYRETAPMKTMEDSYKMLERDKEKKNSGYEFRFAVIEKSSQNLIGTIMYQPVHDKAIIGYSIDEKFWNKGYATRMVKIISNDLKSKKFMIIEAWVKKKNLASGKVLEKNNFQLISQTVYPNSNLFHLKFTYS